MENVFGDDDDDSASSATSGSDLCADPLAGPPTQKGGNKFSSIITKHIALAADAGGFADSEEGSEEEDEEGSDEVESDSIQGGAFLGAPWRVSVGVVQRSLRCRK